MDEITLSSNWSDYVSVPGISLFLLAVALTALYELKNWRSFLTISLSVLASLLVTVFLNLGDVYSMSEQQSGLICIGIVFFVALLAVVLKGRQTKLWPVLAACVATFYGLNGKILKKAFYEQVNLWQDAPLLILKVTAGFMLAYLVLQLLNWLIKTAFTIADRDRLLVVSGGVMGATAILFYQLVSSF